MTSKWKRLALTLVSATLFGVMLTACSGGGGGGGTPSVPSTPSTSTPSEPSTPIVTPADPTSEVISKESTSQSQADENGNYVLTKTYDVTASDVELNSCVVVSDEVYWNEFDGVNRVVSTAAVWRAALETENELVNSLVNEIVPSTTVVCYVVFEYNYSPIGDVETIIVQYDEYAIKLENNNGTLEVVSDNDALLKLGTVLTILSEGEVTNIEQDILGWSEKVYERALEFIKNSDSSEISGVKEGVIETADGAKIQYMSTEDGIQVISWEKQDGEYSVGIIRQLDGVEIITYNVYADDWEFAFCYNAEGDLKEAIVSMPAKDVIPVTRYVQYYGFDGNNFVECPYSEEDWADLTKGSWAEGDISIIWENLLGKGSPTDEEISASLSEIEAKVYGLATTIKAIVDNVE